jgi:hypothetical protein
MRRASILLSLALLPLLAGSAAALVAGGVDPHNLPIGKTVSTTSGARGSVYACSIMSGGGGAFAAGSWIHLNGTYDVTAKPTVDGSVAWPTATVSFKTSGGRVRVRGNGLPKGTHTGVYPVAGGSKAHDYDRNPNRITTQVNYWVLPKPVAAAKPSCLSGGPIGIALNGVSIFDALDAENRDAIAYEILDHCQGHPERNGRYHYHSIPTCLTSGEKTTRHSAVVGYALDGFPITGRRGDGGRLITDADLDACHGHVGSIVLNGKRVRMYHYHATLEFPYTLGCFHGTPLQLQATGGGGAGGGGGGGNGGLTPEPPPQPQG